MWENRKHRNLQLILAPIVFLVVSVIVLMVVCRNGVFPEGGETMYHMYRGETIYKCICRGSLWKFYDLTYSGGVILPVYDAPLSAYFVALCIALAGGNTINGYLICVMLLCFLGAVSWLIVGYKMERPFLGAILGIIWFFLPNNLQTLLGRGEIDYCLAGIFVPLFVYGIIRYAKNRTWKRLVMVLVAILWMVSCCSVVSTAMTGGINAKWILWRVGSMLTAVVFIGILWWKKLRISVLALLLGGICMTCVPSLQLVYGNGSGELATDRLDELQQATLIAKGQEITNQRMAFIDGGNIGYLSAWLTGSYNDSVAGSYGINRRISGINENIQQLDKALASGSYLYLFDRCKALGNDTVIVDTLFVTSDKGLSLENMNEAAERNGYKLKKFNDRYRLYHMEIEGNWGTTEKYRALGIGSATKDMAIMFPGLEETESTNLNDFTLDELTKYDIICLAGFTYDDRVSAEKLVLKASEAGVRVVIYADGIPIGKDHAPRFLGVTCNDISFENGFPELDTVNGILNTDLFPEEYLKWNTVYLEGLDECLGSVYDEEAKLEFYGKVKNDNIYMIGLNLAYFYGVTGDASVGSLLSYAMNLSSLELPRREIVPIKISYKYKTLTIESEKEGVNTGLAWHKQFSAPTITVKNHLIYTKKGKTKARIK